MVVRTASKNRSGEDDGRRLLHLNRQRSGSGSPTNSGRRSSNEQLRLARFRIHELLEDFTEGPGSGSPVKVCVVGGMTAMILVSLVCLVLETEPGLANTPPEVWQWAEAVTTCCFTLEYLMRLWVSDVTGSSMVAWALRPINVCDLLAIVPFYAEFFVSSDISWLRVLRVIRLGKLGRYSTGVQVMSTALANSMRALNILVFLFLIGAVIFASCVYFTERFSCPEFGADHSFGLTDFLRYSEECDPDTGDGTGTSATFGTCCAYQCRFLPSPTPSLCRYEWQGVSSGRRLLNASAAVGNWEVEPMHELAFSSVFTAMWWASATMTTVGYGDIVPKNWISKLIASVAMITGMLIIAMPFAIVGSKFGEAVAVCEAGNARHAAAARLKKVREFGGVPKLSHSRSHTSVEEDMACFEDLQSAIARSYELKQEILRVQQVRDNLWASVEHAMANFTLEGIQTLTQEMQQSEESEEEQDGEHPRLCEWSCFVFHRDSRLRRAAICIVRSVAFEYLVITAILTNSVIMANLDHYPRKVTPWENVLHDRTEIAFIVLFTCECVLQVVAKGFILDRSSYLRDAWNWIDFFVVVIGLVLVVLDATMSASANPSVDLSILRVVRVLRPLRTLSVLPGLRKLVNTILRSLPGLKDVVLMAFFLLAIFGILGLQLYGGVMHRRCRLTPQPLHFTQRAMEPSCSGWCFDNSSLVSLDLGGGALSAPLDSSLVFSAFCGTVPACVQAFHAGRDYLLWPVDPSQERFCGAYQCKAVGLDSLAGFAVGGTNASQLAARVLEPMGAIKTEPSGERKVQTNCGSALDEDSRFAPGVLNSELRGWMLDDREGEVNISSFNYGLTHMDQIGGASLVVFQCWTLEGWVDIMYMLQDAYSETAFFFFLLMIIIGYFFLLNIILAIVYDAFCAADVSRSALVEEALCMTATSDPAAAATSTGPSIEVAPEVTCGSEAHEVAEKNSLTDLLKDLDVTGSLDDLAEHRPKRGWAAVKERVITSCLQLLRRRPAPSVEALLKEPSSWRIRRWARWVASSVVFDSCVMLIISANVVVLSLDRYPTNMLFERSVCEDLNRVCNVMFLAEFIILHAAVGWLPYWCDNALAFDGIIVLLSLPDFYFAIMGTETGVDSLQAIRAFRLLRIFKLAKKFPSMKVLLKACVETLGCMREFVLLLAIVVCVFALVGQSFFGGKFLFDADGSVIPKEEFETRCPFADGGYGKPECVPRAHFDTFLWSVVTIFQILTGENWNAVMYDGMRATHWYALFFFVSVIIIGQFVILNLCLSMLMMNFECHRGRMTNLEKEKKRLTAVTRKRKMSAVVASLQGEVQASTTENYKAIQQAAELEQEVLSECPSGGATPSKKSVFASTGGKRRQFFSVFKRNRAKSCPVLHVPSDGDSHGDGMAQVAPEEMVRSSLSGHSAEEPHRGDWAHQAGKSSDLQVENVSDGPGSDVPLGSQQPQQHLLLPPGQLLLQGQPQPHPQPQPPAREAPALSVHHHPSSSSAAGIVPITSTGTESAEAGRLLPGSMPSEDVHPVVASNTLSRLSAPIEDPEIESVGERPRAAGRLFGRFFTNQSTGLGRNSEQNDMPNLERLVPDSIQKTKHFGSLRRRSCFIFDDAHPLRHLCLYLAKDSRFDQVIIALITISSALMMLQNPLHDPAGTKEVVLGWANVAFTVVFALEMVIKMTAFGMFCGQPGRPAYLQSSWNVLDAFIVTVSVADVLQNHIASSTDAGGGVLGFMKVFRIARVLRPLRLISRNENLKVVVKTIGASLPELRNLSVFSSLFFLIFALLGVSNLKGSFYRCLDHKLEDYPFNQTGGGVTPLCVPPVPTAQARAADIDAAMQFTRQELVANASAFASVANTSWPCPSGWTSWQRPTADTPICEVHCSSEADHPFCARSDRPWGYHTMRCTDCSEEFCAGARADAERVQGCRDFCGRHQYFCKDSGDPNHPACLEQCVSECLCPDRCVGLSQDAALCAEQGGRWMNMNQNFDNLGVGMISLFEICTTEGWVDVMLASADFRGPYLQPRRDAAEFFACALSVAFILIGSFFVLNLCVGVIIDNYHRQKESRGRLMVTPAQNSWIAYQKALYAKRSFFGQTNTHQLPPTRKHLIEIVKSPMFENGIMACIIMNTIQLGMVMYPSPGATYTQTLERFNIAFAVIFNLEFAMKLWAMHFAYFKERWNVFDFICVLTSDFFLILQAIMDGHDTRSLGDVMKGVRIFRIARLFRLVRFLKGLNQLTMAFILSVPKLANVTFIMMLLVYLFAVLGVNLFAEVAYIDNRSYNEYANFRGFWQAMSLLIRSMTGEGWNAIMHDLAKDKFYYESYLNVHCTEGLVVSTANFPSLDLNHDGMVDDEFITGCGKQEMAFTYFITYTLIVTFVILNLFIAVIFEGFEESSKSEVSDVLEKCLAAWRRYDPNNTLIIPLDSALDFIDEVVAELCDYHQAKEDDPSFKMESRWDRRYKGARTDAMPLALYNLRYMRIIGLRVTSSNEVRFVVAVKAVIRGIICQGGFNGSCSSGEARMERLRELEELDRLMTTSDVLQTPGLDKEFVKLRRQERRQARAINSSLRFGGTGSFSSMVVPIKNRLSNSRESRASQSQATTGSDALDGFVDERPEYSLLQEVAAAKIQRRVKEAFQRRRARQRSKTGTHPGRAVSQQPIARAAG